MVLEAALGPKYAPLGMLATVVLYFQQLPTAAFLYELHHDKKKQLRAHETQSHRDQKQQQRRDDMGDDADEQQAAKQRQQHQQYWEQGGADQHWIEMSGQQSNVNVPSNCRFPGNARLHSSSPSLSAGVQGDPRQQQQHQQGAQSFRCQADGEEGEDEAELLVGSDGVGREDDPLLHKSNMQEAAGQLSNHGASSSSSGPEEVVVNLLMKVRL